MECINNLLNHKQQQKTHQTPNSLHDLSLESRLVIINKQQQTNQPTNKQKKTNLKPKI